MTSAAVVPADPAVTRADARSAANDLAPKPGWTMKGIVRPGPPVVYGYALLAKRRCAVTYGWRLAFVLARGSGLGRPKAAARSRTWRTRRRVRALGRRCLSCPRRRRTKGALRQFYFAFDLQRSVERQRGDADGQPCVVAGIGAEHLLEHQDTCFIEFAVLSPERRDRSRSFQRRLEASATPREGPSIDRVSGQPDGADRER